MHFHIKLMYVCQPAYVVFFPSVSIRKNEPFQTQSNSESENSYSKTSESERSESENSELENSERESSQ